MRTGGYANEGFLTLLPIGVLVAVGVWWFGGFSETLHAIDTFVGATARATMRVVSALFS
jgi:hypothetical protein